MVATNPRFLFDEDLIGVGRLIRTARTDANDVWVIGDDPCPIAKGTPDEKWFPVAASRSLIVIRKDRDVEKQHSVEGRLWRDLGIRGFVLRIREPTLWGELVALTGNWSMMENHVKDRRRDGYWFAAIRQGSVKPL